MKTITVVTGARSDYGIYLPILRRIEADAELRLELMVTGMHLAPEFGHTVEQIEADGFTIRDRIPTLLASDDPEAIAQSTGLGTIGFAQAFARARPKMLLLLGDRYEMLAAAVASLPFKIPLAHIHGGESTEGAMDEAIRHAITKFSHLHFAATETYARRIVQLGEEPWRVLVSGAPALDNLSTVKLLSREELQKEFDIDVVDPTLLVTFHPVTLECDQTGQQIDELLAALDQVEANVVVTYPNADTHGRLVIERICRFAEARERVQTSVNLGTQGYFSLMSHAAAMVGNSSSGIIEAASFGLPVVNVGNRQRGRIRDRNVIDVGYGRSEIVAGIRQALSSKFQAQLTGLVNSYGDGHAAKRIIEKLKQVVLDDRLIMKRFHDVETNRITSSAA